MPIPVPDLAALAVFCTLWLGYDRWLRLLGRRTINSVMCDVRTGWMASMLRRENRITDSALLGHVVHSCSFFASTSLIAIGALLSAFGATERIQPAVEALAFIARVPPALFEMKILLPLAVLVYGFFKLTWAIRQLNYTIALIGAAPGPDAVSGTVGDLAEAIGGVMSAALSTFNAGIRSYYFALAGLAWLVGPLALALTAALLAFLLVWRQAASPVARSFHHAAELTVAVHARLGQRDSR